VSSPIRTTVRRLVNPSTQAVAHYYLDPRPLLRRVYSARYRREVELIERELRQLSGNWNDFPKLQNTKAMTERVVEVPWVLSRYHGETHVLDIGTTNANSLYLRYLQGLRIKDLHGVDLARRRFRNIRMHVADVRDMPFPDSHFELVLCISTIEHIGLNNERYSVNPQPEAEGDLATLKEIHRVLAPKGRVLVTTPCGLPGTYEWYRQYDVARWRNLVSEAGFEHVALDLYDHSDAGWHRVSEAAPPAHAYQSGAPAATGVICAELIKTTNR
jgi:SAM-dependent methyltransferase